MSDIDLTTQSINFLMVYFPALRHRLSNHETITTRISGKINAMTPTRESLIPFDFKKPDR